MHQLEPPSSPIGGRERVCGRGGPFIFTPMHIWPGDWTAMHLALQQADAAAAAGEVPVGAVVYRINSDGELAQVLAACHNLREATADPAGHAEFLAMRQAAMALGTWRLDGYRVAVTLEPCPMCAGMMVNARVDACVWGAADPKMGCAGTLHDLLNEPRFNHRVAHAGGIMASESVARLRTFFRARRHANAPAKPRPKA